MSRAYYNEIDPYAAQWLRNLIDAGHIAPGEVDTRSIVDVRPDDLRGFEQCHFFAGIGGWSYALRLAGWADTRPVWTGSCPCQPFSLAGSQRGFDDERHLWPEYRRLIAERRPTVVFGEQVASAGKWPGDLQRMRDREAIERVLQGQSFGNGASIDLQGLLEDEAHRASQEEQGSNSLHLGEATIWAEGYPLRSGYAHQRDTGGHRDRHLPIDWGPVQSGRRNDLGQPVAGSDRLEEGLRARERQSGALLSERDGEPLGTQQDHRDRPGHQDAEDISVRRPSGEDRSGAAQESNWLRSVRGDLEALEYAVGAMPIQAASAGADHLRDRYWFVADADDARSQGRRLLPECAGQRIAGADGVAYAAGIGSGAGLREGGSIQNRNGPAGGRGSIELADAGSHEHERERLSPRSQWHSDSDAERSDGGSELSWIIGADGKARRVKSGIRLLAHGVPARVGKLRGFGNAIDPRPAAEFIGAYMNTLKPSSDVA